MKLLGSTLLLIGALALSACNNPDKFGAGADGAGGLGQAGLGGVGDPTSPAYFASAVGDRVLFAVDQSTLTPEAQQVLVGQAQWLNQNTAYSAIVEGHADEQGTAQYNLELSKRRAAAVLEFLVSQGVSPARLTTVGYGKERPLELCSDEACYSKNRRAVTVISAGAGV